MIIIPLAQVFFYLIGFLVFFFLVVSCLSAILWTLARQTLLSMEFSRQEYWSGLPFPPGDLPDPGIEPMSLVSPALAGGFFTTEPPGKCLKDGSKGRCQDRGRGRKRS